MDFKENYYFEKYEQLAVLADTQKCKTILSRNTDTNEIVVFKVMDKHGLDVYHRLKDLDNSNIVDVMDCFLYEDKCVAVEEFVNGKRLYDILQKNIPVEVIVDYVKQICNGLKEVHNKNIVHRDLQPKNIIVDRHNHITIIDFDIARIRKEEADSDTEFLGTVGYASPEQFGFAQTDKRSDIYSLGVLIGDMVKPYAKTVREASEEEIVYTGTSLTLEEHKIVERLVKMSRKCTEIAPEKRYKSIEEIEKNLKYNKHYNQDILEPDELQELSFRGIIRTVPGFRKKNNILYKIIAIIMYVFVFATYIEIGTSAINVKKGYKWLCVILSEMCWIIPYIYLTNIGDVVYRIRKRKFKYKFFEYLNRIGIALVIWLAILIILSIITLK
jgi:serine/threonine protein kinase